MLKKNDVVTISISDQTETGDGVGKTDGFPLFVRHAAAGDEAEVVITRLKKNYGFAAIRRLIHASADRVDPPCQVWKRCGGCQFQHISYEAQLRLKTNRVRETLRRIGGFSDIEVQECVPSEAVCEYRNKAQYPVGTDRVGRIVAGFYAARSHEIIPCDECLLTPPEFGQIVKTVLSWMEACGIQPYNEQTGTGSIRHIYLRRSFSTRQTGVCLVTRESTIPHSRELVDALKAFPDISGITFSVNPANTNVILGDNIHVLYGDRCIYDSIGAVRYRVDPLSFLQVNPRQTLHLYNCVKEFAGLTGTETVWDLYCGIGTISLFLADKAKNVIGIEVVGRAVEDARENARLNGIENASFYAGDVASVFPEVYSGFQGSDLIVVDPPRKGCDRELLDMILRAGPDKILYVSCNPATLARDLRILADGGYAVDRVRPFDMFPMTGHVETVCLLTHKD